MVLVVLVGVLDFLINILACAFCDKYYVVSDTNWSWNNSYFFYDNNIVWSSSSSLISCSSASSKRSAISSSSSQYCLMTLSQCHPRTLSRPPPLALALSVMINIFLVLSSSLTTNNPFQAICDSPSWRLCQNVQAGDFSFPSLLLETLSVCMCIHVLWWDVSPSHSLQGTLVA